MAVLERGLMDRKIIAVSSKRQITIPQKFYERLQLSNEVECFVEDGALVIRPLRRDGGEFAVQILRELVVQGYSGDDLVKRFESMTKEIQKAVSLALEEADEIASGKRNAATLKDIFGES